MENEVPPPRPWVLVAGLMIGVMTLLFFMSLVGASVFGREVPCNSRFLVVAILSLGVALASSFIGGKVAAEGRIPLPLVKGHPIRFAAVGGVAALILVLVLGDRFYSGHSDCGGGQLSQDVNAMLTNLHSGHYDAALAKADDVLAQDSGNFRALHVKGSVEFYRGNYAQAREDFGKSLRGKPGDKIILSNIGDTYVELGAFDLAIKTYLSAQTDTDAWHYALGRAYLFSGKFDDALTYLQAVKGNEHENAVDIARAAAYVGKSQTQTGDVREKTLVDARAALKRACVTNSEYWTKILVNGKKVEHETYDKIIPLLRNTYANDKPCA